MPPRYAILHHDQIDSPHFDLLFETSPNSPLLAWRSQAWPISRSTPLLHLPDHRGHYLSYEGPLSAGRGTVRRVESGSVIDLALTPAQIRMTLQNDSGTIVLKLALDPFRGEPHWMAEPATGA
jgi:hypothetical protein